MNAKRGRFLKIVIGTVAGALAAAAGAGAFTQAVLARAERRTLTLPGRLVSVGGRTMHVLAMGQGGPTVVLETGASGFHGAWEWVQPDVAARTRVISYDRAGLGFSDSRAGVRDATAIAGELHDLLSQAHETPPFVLVGHSFGGLLVLEYARRFPAQVAGVVLVDPSHPDQIARSAELRRSLNDFRRFTHLASAAAHFGLMRLTGVFSAMAAGLSEERQALARAFFASPRHLSSTARELDAWQLTTDEVRPAALGNIPLLILSATEPDVPWVRQFRALHEEMKGLSTRAEHRIIAGAEHLNLVTDRRRARVVSEAILEMVDQVGSNRAGR